MRIILLHNFYKKPGGEDVVFNQEAKLLRENGHEVECIIFSNESINSTWQTILYFFKSIYNPGSARILKERIKSFKPDIIHIHNTFLVASPSVIKMAFKMNIPVVQTLHNYRLICPSTTLYYKEKIYTKSVNKLFPIDAVIKGVYRNSIALTFLVASISSIHKILGTYKKGISKYIALNNYSMDLFKTSSLKPKENQITVKPNFINDPGKKTSEKENYYIYVGRLEKEKGVNTLLKAFDGIDEQILIIGDGSLKSAVENAAEKNKNIVYLGFQDRAIIIDKIRNAKALIFPSEWYETFGLTIIEAFASSTPVIISELGGHAQMVTENVNGFHFKAGDSEDLKKTLDKFEKFTDKKMLAENARKEYELKYTAEKNYLELIGIYESIIHQ